MIRTHHLSPSLLSSPLGGPYISKEPSMWYIPVNSAHNTGLLIELCIYGKTLFCTNLKITREFFVQGLEEIFSIGLGISFSDKLPLSSIPMSQDRYNQLLVSSPTCNYIWLIKNSSKVKTQKMYNPRHNPQLKTRSQYIHRMIFKTARKSITI